VISIRAFLDAAQLFLRHLSDVAIWPLLASLALQLANLLLRSRAWQVILRAAYPHGIVRWRSVLAAYLAGVGVNSVAPARTGDVVKIAAVHQRTAGSTIATITASLIPETLFDVVAATVLIVWAYLAGLIPGLPAIPHKPAFEWAFFARHIRGFEISLVILVVVAVVSARWAARHLRLFWVRVRQGVTILRSPRRYLAGVVSLQAAGWACRVASAYYGLRAFGIPATLHNALIVLAITAVATVAPLTPGGVGAQQAMVVVALGTQASSTALLAYSVGAQVALTVFNVVCGAVALLVVFRSLRPSHWQPDTIPTGRDDPPGS
jgi:uncharacterized membrane protein YbhN (UPF0104 family)